jgi:hypothetical protein
MEWLNIMSGRLRITWGRWSLLTNGIGTGGYPFSCWPTERQPTRPPVWHLPVRFLDGSFPCPAIWCLGLPQTETLCSQPCRMTAWHSPFRSLATESGQWQDEGALWSVGQLCWVSRRRQSVDVPSYPAEREITQAVGVLGRLLHHHPDQWHHISYSAASDGKDDGCIPGQVGTIPGGLLGRLALRREQCNGWVVYVNGMDASSLTEWDACVLLW